MARQTPFTLAVIALGVLASSAVQASPQDDRADLTDATSDLGSAAMRTGLRRAFRSCVIERYVTDDGIFVVRRVCL